MTTTLEDLLPLLAQLSASPGERRSLAELAADSGRSPSHFQRAFARLIGESPKQYTRRLSLECAAVLLLTTEQSVLDIALDVGFESHEGFTRAFAGQFGLAPTAFRERARSSDLADRLRTAGVIEHVGPCLTLFRAPLTQGDQPVHYDITQQSIPETTLLHQSARCRHDEIAATLGKLLPAVFQHAMNNGIAFAGPPTTVYSAWGPGMVTIDAGLPVAAGTEAAGDVLVRVLPAGTAAVTIHVGPYDGLPDAHAAVEAYLHDNGLRPAGSPREIYLTDPGEVPDPADWKTQIVWPIG